MGTISWQVRPDDWEADSPSAHVRFRVKPSGELQVYMVTPKVPMDEAEAMTIASDAERAIVAQAPEGWPPRK